MQQDMQFHSRTCSVLAMCAAQTHTRDLALLSKPFAYCTCANICNVRASPFSRCIRHWTHTPSLLPVLLPCFLQLLLLHFLLLLLLLL
jgi:hypothetical protein